MIEKYKRQADISAGIFIASGIVGAALVDWVPSDHTFKFIAFLVSGCAIFYSFGAYAAAKGYSALLGLLLPLLTVIGLIILLWMKDLHPENKIKI